LLCCRSKTASKRHHYYDLGLLSQALCSLLAKPGIFYFCSATSLVSDAASCCTVFAALWWCSVPFIFVALLLLWSRCFTGSRSAVAVFAALSFVVTFITSPLLLWSACACRLWIVKLVDTVLCFIFTCIARSCALRALQWVHGASSLSSTSTRLWQLQGLVRAVEGHTPVDASMADAGLLMMASPGLCHWRALLAPLSLRKYFREHTTASKEFHLMAEDTFRTLRSRKIALISFTIPSFTRRLRLVCSPMKTGPPWLLAAPWPQKQRQVALQGPASQSCLRSNSTIKTLRPLLPHQQPLVHTRRSLARVAVLSQ